VILDESETYNTRFSIQAKRKEDESRMIIERHLHHFFENGQLERRVLRHWIPAKRSLYDVELSEKPALSSLLSFADGDAGQVVCFY
jgi:hypothetical protein